MSYRVLGVGVGVFILIVLWICAICLAFAFSKAKRPTSFLGFGCIFLSPFLDNYTTVHTSSFLVSIIFMVIEHWAVSKPAKPLKSY
ncbi:hypothetical protein CEXT_47081 [Caerostris extrusa]|uniref:Transmembrane protein 218 N-terminal domain-containing protein n=1 Tax=Caerostris extrusa TaxID=172846 RepID=A0AAV4N5J4_CAEEX|nr:hypothetical protein CEXT_47081 [Caerostris extrusa]